MTDTYYFVFVHILVFRNLCFCLAAHRNSMKGLIHIHYAIFCCPNGQSFHLCLWLWFNSYLRTTDIARELKNSESWNDKTRSHETLWQTMELGRVETEFQVVAEHKFPGVATFPAFRFDSSGGVHADLIST